MSWESKQLYRNVHEIFFDNVKAGWEQKVLLRSDAHHDNVKNRWDLEETHLKQALEYDAPIIDNGDAFCAMQGKYDPRKDLNQLKDEHKRQDYLDALIETANRDYSPYAEQFAVMGMGNHENSILDRLGTNLTGNLVHRLNMGHKRKRTTFASGYSGWVKFSFRIQKTVKYSFLMGYHHGSGGGGPVTRGTIQTNRQAVIYPDARVLISGHTHDSWIVPIGQIRLTKQGKVYQDIQWHVRTGTYKDDFKDGNGGWHVVTGKPPKIMGAVWMKLSFHSGENPPIALNFEIATR